MKRKPRIQPTDRLVPSPCPTCEALRHRGRAPRASLAFNKSACYSSRMPQDHHYLPQFYQRRWSAGAGHVYVYQRPYDRVVVAPKSTSATGKVAGLYTIPGMPPKRANELEDKFWRVIDQWGSDAIVALEADDPADASKLIRERWAFFVMSLLLRNPIRLRQINRAAEIHYASGFPQFRANYTTMRRPHEPETYDEFMAMFQESGISEYGAMILRTLVANRTIVDHLIAMKWSVVSLSNNPVPLLTSDNPVIRYKGLRDGDGLLMLPLSPREFFVAFNQGGVDMQEWISDSISYGRFVQAMNEYVVRNAIHYVYGHDDAQLEFVERFLPIGPPSLDPLFFVPPSGRF